MATDAGTDPTDRPHPPPPPPPSEGPGTRRLYRYPDRGPLGGVCAGVAEHFGLDVTLVRIGAVILACLGPGIPAYLVGWIFFPAADATSAPPTGARRSDRMAEAIGIGLIIVALSVLWGDWWFLGRGWLLPLGLIALGAWLLARGSNDEVPPVPPTPPAPPPVPPVPPAPYVPGVPGWRATGPTEAPTADPTEGDEGDDTDGAPGTPGMGTAADDPSTEPMAAIDGGDPPDGGGGTGTAPVPPPPAPPEPKPRRGRVLASLVFGGLLLWTGIAWLAGVDLEDGLAVALCLVGVGFVVGAFVGGSKALIVPAIVLAAALATVSVLDIPFEGGVGDRHWSVTELRDLEDSYELGVGEATLDLRDLDLRGRTEEVTVHVGIGHLEVIVPDDIALDVSAEVGAGEVRVLGHRDEGMGVDFDRRLDGEAGRGRLDLDLQLGLGQIEVIAARPTSPTSAAPR